MDSFEWQRQYIGNISQLFHVHEYRMCGGRAEGIHAVDVHNAGGIDFTCSASRCLDLPYVRFKGHNLGYISPTGDVAPMYFDDQGLGWLKSFTAGFLTTCGLRYIGKPSEYAGQTLGLHGSIGNTPATQFSAQTLIDKHGEPYVELRGQMFEGTLGSDRLSLTRTICNSYSSREIALTDIVRNEGFSDARHMILYHFNFGYPLLQDASELLLPSRSVRARDEIAQTGIGQWNRIQPPQANFREMCYYHELRRGPDGATCVGMYNPQLETGVVIHFNIEVLDHFVQWKQLGLGDYVIGMEPCNGTIDGIDDAINRGALKTLKPGEQIVYQLRIQQIDSSAAWSDVQATAQRYE